MHEDVLDGSLLHFSAERVWLAGFRAEGEEAKCGQLLPSVATSSRDTPN